MNLSNLKIKTRILIILLIPVIGMFFFLSNNVVEQYEFIQKRKDLAVLVKLTPVISSFVHELQKERAFSTLYVMHKGAEKHKKNLLESSDYYKNKHCN